MSESLIPPVADGAPDPAPGGEVESQSSGQSGQENQIQALTRKLRKLEKLEADRVKAEEERKTKDLSETEQLRKRLAELEQERTSLQSVHRATLMQVRFEAAAQKAGAVDAAAAWKLADTSTIDLDDSGNVIGIETAIKSLQKSSPYLFGAAPAPVSSGGGNPAGGQSPPKIDADAIKKMTPAEFAKLREGVKSGAVKL